MMKEWIGAGVENGNRLGWDLNRTHLRDESSSVSNYVIGAWGILYGSLEGMGYMNDEIALHRDFVGCDDKLIFWIFWNGPNGCTAL